MKTPRVRPQDIGDAVNVLKALRGGCNGKVTTAGDDGSGRDNIAHIIGEEAVAADVVEPRVGIIKFNELNVVAVDAWSGFVHDFRDDDGSFAAGRADDFVRNVDGAQRCIGSNYS